MSGWLSINIPPMTALYAQLMLGLVNGAFYATLSLGLAIIYGMLGMINFTHGALYMMGAFFTVLLLRYFGIDYWGALFLAPLGVAIVGLILERTLIRRTYKLDHAYSMLLTFGLTLVIEGVFRFLFTTAGQGYSVPQQLTGATNLGFIFMPNYRLWVLAVSLFVCAGTWFIIERTPLGARSRAATENALLTQGLGVNVPRMMALTFAFGVGLAGFAGVLAAPLYIVNPLMGTDLLVIVFAVVVIGGMGSIGGSIVAGFLLGVIEGLTKAILPWASQLVIFAVMALVLLARPAGLFGRGYLLAASASAIKGGADTKVGRTTMIVLLALALVAPMFVYPVFLMKALCFALFACSFNLLIGYGGLLSFGHAAFFGTAAYATGYAARSWGFTPELAILFGVVVSAAIAWVFGTITVRRQGIYLAMISLALSQLIYFLCLRAPFTGGEDGMQGVPRGHLFGLIDLAPQMTMYYFVLAVFVIGFFCYWFIVNSPFGLALRAVRENEPRAISLGYRANRIRILAFVLSGALAGLGGATKVLVFGIAALTDVHFFMSGEIVLITLLGGLGTVLGPVLGAFTMISLESFLQTYGEWLKVVQGAFLIVCVLALRQGLMGLLQQMTAAFSALRKGREPAATEAPSRS